MKRSLILYLSTLFFLFACALPPLSKTVIIPKTKDGKTPKSYEVNGQRYYPLPDAEGFVQNGKASWYGKAFHGRPTASGEIYDMNRKSAAHKTLPLGTYVKVLNLSNKKETVVKVNDRGPFVKGRIIDLSYAAAKEIDMVGSGVVDAKIIALGREVGQTESKEKSKLLVEYKDLSSGEFTIQVGSFQKKENAQKLTERLKVIFGYVNITTFVDEKHRTLYRVHVSKSGTLTRAGEIEKRLEDMGFDGAFVFRL